jgi:hypothetical protein
MKRILAIAAAAAAITAGASAANAQSCDHGIVMHGNVPTTCGGANGAGDVNGNADELPSGVSIGHRGFFSSLFGSGTSTPAVDAGGANGAGDVNGNADELATNGQGNFANTEPVYTGSSPAVQTVRATCPAPIRPSGLRCRPGQMSAAVAYAGM